jgi:hypothetical protein
MLDEGTGALLRTTRLHAHENLSVKHGTNDRLHKYLVSYITSSTNNRDHGNEFVAMS